MPRAPKAQLSRAGKKAAVPAAKKASGRGAAKHATSHPTYEHMVVAALGSHPGNTRESKMSVVKIEQFMGGNWKLGPQSHHLITEALKSLIAHGLVKTATDTGRRWALTRQGRTSLRSKSGGRKRVAAAKQPRVKKVPAKRGEKVKAKAKATRPSAAADNARQALATAAASQKKKLPVAHAASMSRGVGSTTFSVNIPGSKYTHYWQYKDDTRGGWCNYDLAASEECEKVYLGYLKNRGDTDVRSVKSGHWSYMVDFAAMKQTNLEHESHTVRDIRRVANTCNPSQ